MAEKHGADSPRRVGPLAAELAAELVESAPWVARPAYRATLAAWCRVEAQLRLVSEYLDRVGLLDEDGRPRPATNLQDRLESRAAKLRSQLGLDPMSLSRLMLTVSAVERAHLARGGSLDGLLDELAAEGRAALSASESREGVVGTCRPVLGAVRGAERP